VFGTCFLCARPTTSAFLSPRLWVYQCIIPERHAVGSNFLCMFCDTSVRITTTFFEYDESSFRGIFLSSSFLSLISRENHERRKEMVWGSGRSLLLAGVFLFRCSFSVSEATLLVVYFRSDVELRVSLNAGNVCTSVQFVFKYE